MRGGLLLLSLLPATAAGAFIDTSDFNVKDAIRGLPGMIKSNWNQFKTGTSLMWQNGKAAKLIRQRVRASGDGLTYAEMQLEKMPPALRKQTMTGL